MYSYMYMYLCKTYMHLYMHMFMDMYMYTYINAGLSGIQSVWYQNEKKKLTMLGSVTGPSRRSPAFLLSGTGYKIMVAGMPMPALVSPMSMPSYHLFSYWGFFWYIKGPHPNTSGFFSCKLGVPIQMLRYFWAQTGVSRALYTYLLNNLI